MASSKTMKGAWPPNSIETFLTVPAHFCNKIFPISVDPVNDNFLTIGFEANSSPIADAFPVITFKVPLGKPASSANTAKARAEKGV